MNAPLVFKEDNVSLYCLSLDLEGEATICIKAENDIQIQDKYSKVFVFKEKHLRILALQENHLEIWGICADKSVEIEVKIPEFPFYKSASKSAQTELKANKLIFSVSKTSLLKDFITGLFKEKSQEYSWMSTIDGNGFCVDFGDQAIVSTDDPVILSRFLQKLLNWAQIPIVVSSVQLDKESFRRTLRFWVEELIKKGEMSPIQKELLEIEKDEGGAIDYFDQEFLDELKVMPQEDSSIFTREFIEFKIQQLVHEYFRSKGASQHNIEKTAELVKQMKNPDVELIESIVFNTTDFS